MTITLNEREISMVLDAVNQYIDIMTSGEDTIEYTKYMMDTGLGSAMKKLYKGKIGEAIYSNFVSHRENYKYPTFEEWEMSRKDDEQNE